MSPQPHSNLEAEASAFDRQIDARIANGHIPDLRRATPCDWFYNNPWRRPAYVELDFGEQFQLIRDTVKTHTIQSGRPARVLEVGCGPGYLSLEMARAGFDVTGVDLSTRCVEIAQQFRDCDPFAEGRGSLSYLATDFLRSDQLAPGSFDAVFFLGALHHFAEQDAVARRVSELLVPNGLCIVHEPVRDRVTRGNALFVHLVRVLLSAGRGFYDPQPIPTSNAEAVKAVDRIFASLRYESDDGQNVQSVNDNEAGYAEMYPVLTRHFEQVDFRWRYAFFHELIGGLRFAEAENEALARYLRFIDGQLCAAGVLSPTEFFFVGRRREG
jgi:SAM-dependent methyltransferase